MGRQEPTYRWVPAAFDSASGRDAIELGHSIGIDLDPWQGEDIMTGALGEEADDTWTVNEVGVIVGRQNGKGGIIEVRELAGIFCFGETLILHSAHEFKTSGDAFKRMRVIVESNPDLDRKVMNISRSKGDEGITFRVDGREAVLRYMTRTGGAGRGFTKANLVVLDEAMILDDAPIAALLPTMATQPKWQVWYTGSAGDLRLRSQSVVLGRIRRRGYRQDPDLAFWAWEAHLRHAKTCHKPHASDDRCERCDNGEPFCQVDDRNDPKTWAKTNPAMGRRITQSFLRKMQATMAAWDFDREFLGVGDYPDDDGWTMWPRETWNGLKDPESCRGPVFAVGIETTWDGESTSVSIASRRDDGLYHVELCDTFPGTAWAVPYAVALKKKRPCGFVVDRKSPAGVLIPQLVEAGIKDVIQPTLPEYAEWCGRAHKMVTETQEMRHLGQESMDKAVGATTKRDLGQGTFVWERAGTTADVTPWGAATMALGGLIKNGSKRRRRPLVASAQRVTTGGVSA